MRPAPPPVALAPLAAGPPGARTGSAAPRDRSRLLLAWLGALGIAVLLGIVLVLWMLRPAGPERYGIRDPLEVGPGAVLLAEAGQPQVLGRGRVWLVALDGGLIALDNRSPHLGCRMDWKPHEARFVDPCHGQFHHRSGRYEKGPTARDMARLAIYAFGADGELRAWSAPDDQPLSAPPDSRVVIDLGSRIGSVPESSKGR